MSDDVLADLPTLDDESVPLTAAEFGRVASILAGRLQEDLAQQRAAVLETDATLKRIERHVAHAAWYLLAIALTLAFAVLR